MGVLAMTTMNGPAAYDLNPIAVGERIVIVRGRLKGSGGMVSHVTERAVGFWDEATNRTRWIELGRVLAGDVERDAAGA